MPTDVTQAQETASFAAHEAIAATLQQYIDAARTGKGGLMRLAFADNARISGTRAGTKVDWTLQEFCDLIDKGGPVADLDARVVSIEYQGSAGMARLEARNWRGTRYTDFFVLLKQGDTWQIANKVFFAHSRA
jgi:Putative lumazine-binding